MIYDVHARVVEVLRDGAGRGSGYAIAADLVLTAAHVVADDAEVRVIAGDEELRGTVLWRDPELDAALVRASARRWDGVGTRWGILSGVHPVSCTAIGYPRVQKTSNGVRAEEHIAGFIMPAAAHRVGRYAVNVTSALPYDLPRGDSPWSGMSGAALLTGDGSHVLGVLVEDPTGFAPSRLEAVPVADLLDNAGFARLVGAGPAALATVTGRPAGDRAVRLGAGPAAADNTHGYLTLLAESYQWLELQGIREAGSLRIELEKVYVALAAEPESDYDLRHLANLHSLEVREAAGGTALDLIEPTRLEELDAQNVRRTYRPLREAARRAGIAEVQTIAGAFKQHSRMVLLGGPGSGKTTLGRWLALQLARGMLRQLPHEVEAEAGPALPDEARIHVPAATTSAFARSHFVGPEQAEAISAIRIDEPPARGTLALSGRPVRPGQVVTLDQVDRMTFTPAGHECGGRYAHVRYTAGGPAAPAFSGTIVIDVGVHILVPLSQIDPDHSDGPAPERLVDLGPARVPIFLRLAHFARELAERERERKPALSLEEYLGRDPDSCGRNDGCTPPMRNALLRQHLERDGAVVILDGLDELPEANRRTVSLKIQDFIDKATRPNAADAAWVPWRAGGNQVVVTSRYVGYKLMPIRSGCAHFGIQPMRRPAVEHFARAWTRAVSAELGIDRPAGAVAEALIGEIYDEARPAIRELATNPLLITILATVYLTDGHLPDQRAGVYDRVVENLLRIWLNRPECQAQELKREELLAALEPLAADMQENRSTNGLIGLDRIAELVEGPLALMRRSGPADRSFRPVLEALLATIRNHVGLLAEQSSGNYAFFHRTFQEFLAARHLLSDREHAAARIVARLDDPLWREPLLLAVGLVMASPEWGGPETRARVLEDVLVGDDRDPLIPRGAMLVVSALPNLDDVPVRVVARIVEQLLGCYAFSQRQSQAERLREEICDVFARLRDGPQADLVAKSIGEAIQRNGAARDHAGAAAEVLLRIGWFTTGTVDALLRVVHRDQPDLGWPVHWALLAALGQSASGRPWPRPAPALNTSRLVATHLPMRRLLESSPELTAFVREDVGWLWLLVALYGGLGHVGVRERLQAYQKRRIDEVRSLDDDPVDEPAGPPPPIPPIEFCPGDIVHDLADAELSRAVLRQLRARRPSGELAAAFRRAWERGADPAGAADGVVGLAALGQDVVPLVRAALADRDRRPAARAALDRFRWLRSLLREPIIRSAETAARTLPDEAPEARQLDLLRIVIAARAAAGGGPLAVSDWIPALRFVDAASAPIRDAVDAEGLAYLFSGLPAGAGDPMAVMLGRSGGLSHGWAKVSLARNHLARRRLPWPQRPLGPQGDTPVEHYLAMLDGLLGAPPERDFLAGRTLGQCGSLLSGHPELIWETLAVCRLRGPDFVKGYLAGATGERVLSSAYASVAGDLVGWWSHRRLTGQEAETLRLAVEAILRRRVNPDAVAGGVVVKASVAVLVQAAQIADPYLRFRALWRLSGRTDHEPVVAVRLDLADPIAMITDHHDRARALEWLMMTIPDMRIGLGVGEVFDLDELVRLFACIEDPENRARAQSRLALLAPERLEDLLGAVAESVGQIADPVRRAETISEIRSAMGRAAQLATALDTVAESLPEAWLTNLALGRGSRLVATHQAHYGLGSLVWRRPAEIGSTGAALYRHAHPTGRLAWAVVYLDATAAEVGALGAAATGDAADWELLLGPDWQDGVDALIESAADGALRITAREASVLNRVVQSGRSEVLERLWGYLESADAQTTAIATRWTAVDEHAERWKALVQAEAGRLTAQNVDRLVELVTDATDRLRLRGALALHGPRPFLDNPNRRWSTTRVGAETIEAIGRHMSRVDYAPSVCSTLNWTQCDIHHDDADALQRWLAEAAADPDSSVHAILKNIESVDESLVTLLLDALPAAPAALQQTLLTGLSQLAYAGVLDGSERAVLTAVSAVPVQVRREVRSLPEGPATCLSAVAAAAARPDAQGRLDAARSSIEAATLWVDDECLSGPATCLGRLRSIGEGLYVRRGSNGYWGKAEDAATDLAENEDALRLLLSWIESLSLTEDSARLLSHLLTAADALARVSPNAFTALADPETWEPILAEFVETAGSWPGRLAAVRMLGLLRRVTGRVADALRACMHDVALVQQAAYASVEDFRSMEGDLTEELLRLLDDEDAAVVASTARLLVSLARGEGASADRRRILRGLQETATRSLRARNVYLMYERDGDRLNSIQHVERLDRILYRAIFEVNGL
ncbi:trypsin-like peptidase domain-containing protein [Dactylosporangium sp. CA-233914]|uniref:trypsin-like peptidase domain-containing protein n=1 Tax=Dactylosporangium sp. CA-233914 TaxID=3239934 RepID=UPI003D8B5E61